jgi:hypothetical protein
MQHSSLLGGQDTYETQIFWVNVTKLFFLVIDDLAKDYMATFSGTMTLSIMTLSIMTLSIMTHNIMTLSIMTHSIMILSMMTLSIMTTSITNLA